MIKLNKLQDSFYILQWINKFLSDLEERFHCWTLKNSEKIVKGMTDNPFDMVLEENTILTLQGKKWKFYNTNHILSFLYSPQGNKRTNYSLVIKMDKSSISFVILDLKKDLGNELILNLCIKGLNWNYKNQSFILTNPLFSIKKSEDNVEFKKIKTKLKLFPQMDQDFEGWFRSVYNSVILTGLENVELYRKTVNANSFELETDQFYYSNFPEYSPIFLTKNWKNLKSPNQLIFEDQVEKEKQNQSSPSSITYVVMGDGVSLKRITYPIDLGYSW